MHSVTWFLRRFCLLIWFCCACLLCVIFIRPSTTCFVGSWIHIQRGFYIHFISFLSRISSHVIALWNNRFPFYSGLWSKNLSRGNLSLHMRNRYLLLLSSTEQLDYNGAKRKYCKYCRQMTPLSSHEHLLLRGSGSRSLCLSSYLARSIDFCGLIEDAPGSAADSQALEDGAWESGRCARLQGYCLLPLFLDQQQGNSVGSCMAMTNSHLVK